MSDLLHIIGPERDQYVVQQRRMGRSLTSIARDLGISRERVRQLAGRGGSCDHGWPNASPEGVDPLALLRFARSRECGSIKQCAQTFGVSEPVAYRIFRELGVSQALTRLYRMRRGAELRRRIPAQLHAFVAKHGRPPTTAEMNNRWRELDLPYTSDLQRAYGSVARAWGVVGIEQRKRGYALKGRPPKTHCNEGHPLTPDNVYLYHTKLGYTQRQCRACRWWRDRQKKERSKQEGRAMRRAQGAPMTR